MTPRLLHKLSNKFIMTISVGAECSVAMDSAGLVYVWGRADSGQVSELAPLLPMLPSTLSSHCTGAPTELR